MLDIIAIIRPYLEAIYFIASIFLLGGMLLTYLQVKLIKQDIRNRNTRASAEKAIDVCGRYFSDFVPLISINFEEKIAKEFGAYTGPIGDFTHTSLPNPLNANCLKRFGLKSWLPAMNQLESISATFIAGVADECVGFQIIGRTFCSNIETNYDLISLSRREKAYPYWLNSVKLYQLWRPRLTKAEIDLAIREMEEKSSAIQDEKLTPIGVSK